MMPFDANSVRGVLRACSLLACCCAARVLAGPIETTTAAVLPPPFYRLSAERTNLVFREGEKIEIRVEPVSNAPAGQRLTLWGEDAWGRTVFERSVSAPAPGESRRLRIDADGRRYLRLRLTPRAEPAATNALLSLVVIPPPPAFPDPRFGFNTAPRLSPLVRRLGGFWVRAHLSWEQGAENGPLQSTEIERTLAEIQAAGCGVFGISSYSLPWAAVVGPEDRRPMRGYFSVPRPAPWDAYVQHTAQVIRGRVPVFEVWNEPNLDMFWASVPDSFEQRLDDYAALLKRTYPIMKREAPDLKITNGSIVNTRRGEQHRYFDGLLARGGGAAFDVLNLHYYRGGRAPEVMEPRPEDRLEEYLQQFHDALAGAHLEKPIWMTEIGWSSTDPGWGFCSEFEQLCYVIRSQVLCFAAGVETVLWFKLEGEPFGLLDETRGPKPALAAYAQLANALRGKTYRTALSRDNCRVYVFAGTNNDAVAVAWAVTPDTWRLPGAYQLSRTENALGEPVPLRPKEGLIPLTEAPLFLYGRWKASEEAR
jgi:hypothetical protein